MSQQQQRETKYLTLLEFEMDDDKETEKAYRINLNLTVGTKRARRWVYLPKSRCRFNPDGEFQVEDWLLEAKAKELSETVFSGNKVVVLCCAESAQEARHEARRGEPAQRVQEAVQAPVTAPQEAATEGEAGEDDYFF